MKKYGTRPQGLTLIELVIGMSLTLMLMTAVFALLSTSLISWRLGSTQTDLQQTARIAVDSMVRELRFARQINGLNVGETANSITFVNGESPAKTVTFQLGTGSANGTNPNIVYRSVNSASNPFTDAKFKVTQLSFTRVSARIVQIKFVLTQPEANNGQPRMVELQTAVACMNIPE